MPYFGGCDYSTPHANPNPDTGVIAEMYRKLQEPASLTDPRVHVRHTRMRDDDNHPVDFYSVDTSFFFQPAECHADLPCGRQVNGVIQFQFYPNRHGVDRYQMVIWDGAEEWTRYHSDGIDCTITQFKCDNLVTHDVDAIIGALLTFGICSEPPHGVGGGIGNTPWDHP